MIPELYLKTIGSLVGVRSMLELGNKRGTGGPGDTYKKHFETLGIEHVSVDWNGSDGALALDLRKNLQLGRRFDMVTNIGTSEHVDRQEPAWRNMVDHCRKVLVCITPFPGDWPGHGFFYPTLDFYSQLASFNDFSIQLLEVHGQEGRRLVHFRGARMGETTFTLPNSKFLTVAPPRARPAR